MPRSEKSKEQRKAYHREKYKKNPAPYIAYAKRHRHTDRGREIKQCSAWKIKGIRNINNEMYCRWRDAKNCEICNISLTDDKKTTASRRCLEHDHISGYVRSVCCSKCNNKISGVDKTRYILLLEIHRRVDKVN